MFDLVIIKPIQQVAGNSIKPEELEKKSNLFRNRNTLLVKYNLLLTAVDGLEKEPKMSKKKKKKYFKNFEIFLLRITIIN